MGNGIRTAVIAVVTLVWAANFITPIFATEYQPNPELNVAFMAIIGVLTASYRINADGSGDGNNGSQGSTPPAVGPAPEETTGTEGEEGAGG